MEKFRLAKIYVDGIRCLRAVEIDTTGAEILELTGDNGAGKSSILDAIMIAILGTKSIKRANREYPKSEIIEKDKKTAIIKVTLESEERTIKIQRTMEKTQTAGLVNKIEITDTSGQKITQKFLDSLINLIAIDPLALSNMTPAEQQEIIKEITGENLEEHENKIQEIENRKNEYNKEITHKQNAAIELKEKMPKETLLNNTNYEQEINALQKQEQENQQIRTNIQQAEHELNTLQTQYKNNQNNINEINDEIKKLIAKRESLTQQNETINIQGKQQQLQQLQQNKPQNTEEIQQKINKLYSDKEAQTETKRIQAQYETIKQELTNAKEKIQEIKQEKKDAEDAMAQTMQKMPINKMQFNRTKGIIIEEIPLIEMSTAEKINIGLKIAKKTNQQLQTIIIRDGSLLDNNLVKTIQEFAKENETLVLLETVRKQTDDHIYEIIEGTAKRK